jgi:hypothetical protein
VVVRDLLDDLGTVLEAHQPPVFTAILKPGCRSKEKCS